MSKLPICCITNKVSLHLVFAVQICTFKLYNSRFGKINRIILQFLSQIVSYPMPRYFQVLLLACFPLANCWAQSPAKNIPFTYGEELLFEVAYGWVDLAEAKLQVGKKPVFLKKNPVHWVLWSLIGLPVMLKRCGTEKT